MSCVTRRMVKLDKAPLCALSASMSNNLGEAGGIRSAKTIWAQLATRAKMCSLR